MLNGLFLLRIDFGDALSCKIKLYRIIQNPLIKCVSSKTDGCSAGLSWGIDSFFVI